MAAHRCRKFPAENELINSAADFQFNHQAGVATMRDIVIVMLRTNAFPWCQHWKKAKGQGKDFEDSEIVNIDLIISNLGFMF